jgi:hypothetical protein
VTDELTAQDCRTPVERCLWRELQIARKERDEARRLVCEMQAQKEQGTPEGWAQEMGWDCFKADDSNYRGFLGTSNPPNEMGQDGFKETP